MTLDDVFLAGGDDVRGAGHDAAERLAADLAWEWAVSVEILCPSALRAELRAESSDQLLETRP